MVAHCLGAFLMDEKITLNNCLLSWVHPFLHNNSFKLIITGYSQWVLM